MAQSHISGTNVAYCIKLQNSASISQKHLKCDNVSSIMYFLFYWFFANSIHHTLITFTISQLLQDPHRFPVHATLYSLFETISYTWCCPYPLRCVASYWRGVSLLVTELLDKPDCHSARSQLLRAPCHCLVFVRYGFANVF